MNNYLNMPMAGPTSSSIVNTSFGNKSTSMSFSSMLPAFSFGADILQGIFGAWQNNQNLKAQQEENQKNRDFAEQMYYQQRKDNIAQWQMQNAYNAPDAQVERFKMAGLNPDLLYSGGFNDSTPLNASTPSVPSGSVSPQSYNPIELTEKALSISRQKAEIDNINANTRKTNAEGSIFESDAKFRDAINQGVIDANNVRIQFDKKGMDLTDAQIEDFRRQWQKIDQDIEESKARISQIVVQNKLYDQQAIGQYIDNQFKSPHWQAVIENVRSQTKLNYQQAYDLCATLANRLLLMDAQIAQAFSSNTVNNKTANKIDVETYGIQVQNGILDIDLQTAKDTSFWASKSQNSSNILNVVTFGLSGVLQGFLGGAASKLIK